MGVLWVSSRRREVAVPLGPCGTPYVAGQAALFNSGGYLRMASHSTSALNLSNDWSLTFWFWLASSDTDQVFLGKQLGFSAANTEWSVFHPAGTAKIQAYFSNGSALSNTAVGTALSLSGWHLCVVNKSNTSPFDVYIDNSLYNSTAIPGGQLQDQAEFRIGAEAFSGQYPLSAGSKIDAVGIFDGLLMDASQRSVLWNGGAGIRKAGLTPTMLSACLAWYELDEVAGSTTYCDWVNSNALTNVGGVTTTAGKT
jgi:hypothetical protein